MKYKLRISLIINLLILVCFLEYLNAAPLISVVQGTANNGQSLTILGSGFGSKGANVPILWDTVENQYPGLTNGQTIPTGSGYPWEHNAAARNLIKYCSTAIEQRGRYSSSCYKASNTSNASLWGHKVEGATYLYVSWWWKTANDVSGTNHSSKFLRLSDSTDIPNATFSWTQMQNYVYDATSSCMPGYCTNVWVGTAPSVNQWHFFEAYFDSENMTYTLRVDNSSIVSNKSFSPGSLVFDYVWKVGFDGGGDTPPLITSWMDDIYIDNTPQHAVIGNASTYDGCNHLEVQPTTEWNSNGQSVTIKVNQGSFLDGQTAYLYVFDLNGSVNAVGHPITFGRGSSSGDMTPPTAPTGISTSVAQ